MPVGIEICEITALSSIFQRLRALSSIPNVFGTLQGYTYDVTLAGMSGLFVVSMLVAWILQEVSQGSATVQRLKSD